MISSDCPEMKKLEYICKYSKTFLRKCSKILPKTRNIYLFILLVFSFLEYFAKISHYSYLLYLHS